MRIRSIAVPGTLAALLLLTGCSSDDDAGPAPTTSAAPNETVPADEVPAPGETVPGNGVATPTPLAEGDLFRVDVDCADACARRIAVDDAGGYRLADGDGAETTGALDPAALAAVRDALLTTDFATLRDDVADTCTADDASAPVTYQFRVGDHAESITACGAAPADSALLAGVQVLVADASSGG